MNFPRLALFYHLEEIGAGDVSNEWPSIIPQTSAKGYKTVVRSK